MKPDRCSFCKGKLYAGKTEFVAKVGDEVISRKELGEKGRKRALPLVISTKGG